MTKRNLFVALTFLLVLGTLGVVQAGLGLHPAVAVGPDLGVAVELREGHDIVAVAQRAAGLGRLLVVAVDQPGAHDVDTAVALG